MSGFGPFGCFCYPECAAAFNFNDSICVENANVNYNTFTLVYLVDLVATDYIEVIAFQDSGSSKELTSNIAYTYFSTKTLLTQWNSGKFRTSFFLIKSIISDLVKTSLPFFLSTISFLFFLLTKISSIIFAICSF